MRLLRSTARFILWLAALAALTALGLSVGRWAFREPVEEPPSLLPMVRTTEVLGEQRAEADIDDGGAEEEDEGEAERQALSEGDEEGDVDAGPREPGTLALEALELVSGSPARHLRLQLAEAGATEAAALVVETDASGRAFADLPEGDYLISPLEGSWALDVEGVAVRARSTSKVRVLIAPVASLRCRVVDEAGAPVVGAVVEASASGGVHTSVEATSGDDGVAVLAPLFPDRWDLLVSADGFERGRVSANAGRPNTEAQVTMHPARRQLDGGPEGACHLRGQVVDRRGTPAVVTVAASCGATATSARSGPDGRFGLEDLAAGRCTVTARGHGERGAGWARAEVDCPGQARLELAQGGTVELFVDGVSSEPTASAGTALGLRVWLFDSAGQNHSHLGSPVVFDSVSAGPARFYLHSPMGAASGSLAVQVGQTARVRVTLGAGGVRVSGRLLHGRSGEPLSGAHVQLPVPFEGNAWPQAVTETGVDGTFAFVGAARGRATICAHREGFLVWCWVGDLQQDLELGEVRLEPGATDFPHPGALGFSWTPAPGGARVARVEAGSPSGLEVGDLVIAVDGRATDGLGEADLEVLLAGPVDGAARLDVVRSGTAMKLVLPR